MEKLSDERVSEICNGKAVIGTYLEFEKMATELLSTRAELAALQDKVRWVPVSERLPDEGKKVLVDWLFNPMSEDNYEAVTATAYLNGNEWTCLEWPGVDRPIDHEFAPTHWMPLPSSPIPAEGE